MANQVHTLNFPGHIPRCDIYGRLLGPDMHGGYVVAVDATWDADTDKTKVLCRPAAPQELRGGNIVSDQWGQPWLNSLVEIR